MKFVITALIALAGFAANAATARLGATTVSDGEDKVIIDVRNATGVKAIALNNAGPDVLRISEVTVSYRTEGIKRYKVRLNKNLLKGQSTGWIALPDNGLPIRRVTIEGDNYGFFGEARVVVLGSN